jgi:hypothetical protein
MSHTLHIGFSFAIRQDGSPGICNQAIARRMLQQWQEAPGSGKPDMGAQWEIYDALEEMGAPVETMFPGAALWRSRHASRLAILEAARGCSVCWRVRALPPRMSFSGNFRGPPGGGRSAMAK